MGTLIAPPISGIPTGISSKLVPLGEQLYYIMHVVVLIRTIFLCTLQSTLSRFWLSIGCEFTQQGFQAQVSGVRASTHNQCPNCRYTSSPSIRVRTLFKLKNLGGGFGRAIPLCAPPAPPPLRRIFNPF